MPTVTGYRFWSVIHPLGSRYLARAAHTLSGRESQLLQAFLTGKLLVSPYVFILPLYSGV